jgi:hypothetical protein
MVRVLFFKAGMLLGYLRPLRPGAPRSAAEALEAKPFMLTSVPSHDIGTPLSVECRL